MKNILKLAIVFILLFSFQSKAQLDTLNYLKQFEANKANYIGQPFSKLLDDMTQIQPKTVWSQSIFNNKNILRNTRFKFCNMNKTFNGNVINLDITWQIDIPRNETKALSTQNEYYFTNEEKNFYGNKIVKDIIVYRH